jgi:hypothetical protein
VEEVRKTVNSAKNSDKMTAKPTVEVKVRIVEPAFGENTKRATEIGPVLEEILHSHWEHWGLNE